MDILKFALPMEVEIGDCYRQLASHAPHGSLRNALLMLAVAEDNHVQSLSEMKRDIAPDLRQSELLDDAEGLLKTIRADLASIDFVVDELQVYERARDIEYEKEVYYRRKVQQTNSRHQRSLFIRLAREHHRHFFLMDKLCTRLSRTRSADIDAYSTFKVSQPYG